MNTPQAAPPTTQQLLTIQEASERLRISRWAVYQAINRRELVTLTIGRRRFVHNEDLTRFIQARREAEVGS